MNVKKVVRQLKKKYPGKNIILNPPDNPTEIVCELELTKDHPEKSLALAVIGRSYPHYHKKTREVYEVVKGEMNLYSGKKKYEMKKGDKKTIKPGNVHWVESSDECWFYTYATPGWTLQDHIIVKKS